MKLLQNKQNMQPMLPQQPIIIQNPNNNPRRSFSVFNLLILLLLALVLCFLIYTLFGPQKESSKDGLTQRFFDYLEQKDKNKIVKEQQKVLNKQEEIVSEEIEKAEEEAQIAEENYEEIKEIAEELATGEEILNNSDVEVEEKFSLLKKHLQKITKKILLEASPEQKDLYNKIKQEGLDILYDKNLTKEEKVKKLREYFNKHGINFRKAYKEWIKTAKKLAELKKKREQLLKKIEQAKKDKDLKEVQRHEKEMKKLDNEIKQTEMKHQENTNFLIATTATAIVAFFAVSAGVVTAPVALALVGISAGIPQLGKLVNKIPFFS